MNETILPVDFQAAGQMEDDELHMIMVRPLPVGCRLTALFDSCHSGTALDLPYVYSTSGKIKEPSEWESMSAACRVTQCLPLPPLQTSPWALEKA